MSITTSATPPIRVGIVRANPARGWGTVAHLPALRALDEFQVVAMATTRHDTARATAEAYGVPHALLDAIKRASDTGLRQDIG